MIEGGKCATSNALPRPRPQQRRLPARIITTRQGGPDSNAAALFSVPVCLHLGVLLSRRNACVAWPFANCLQPFALTAGGAPPLDASGAAQRLRSFASARLRLTCAAEGRGNSRIAKERICKFAWEAAVTARRSLSLAVTAQRLGRSDRGRRGVLDSVASGPLGRRLCRLALEKDL